MTAAPRALGANKFELNRCNCYDDIMLNEWSENV
jgi:hypothetical protein